MVGFVVIHLRRPAGAWSSTVRGTAEQWIKDGNLATRGTPPPPRVLGHSVLRSSLTYSPRFLSSLALSDVVAWWTLTTLPRG